MKILALETSTTTGSIALSTPTELLAEYQIGIKTNYSDMLLPAIEQLLHATSTPVQDIGAFAIAQGPGSFTALRIGMSVVKGLALATAKPVVAVSTIDVLAQNMLYAHCLVCPLLDARRHEVYTAFFKRSGDAFHRLIPDRAIRPEKLLDEIEENVIFLGDGAARYRDLIASVLGDKAFFAPLPLSFPRASAVAALAFDAVKHRLFTPIESLTPLYVRPPEAEIKWEKNR